MDPMPRKTISAVSESMRPIQRTSVSDEIVVQLTDLIARNVLKPGDRLPPERELCKQFGVGRSSLREALRSLAVMGILDGRIGEGTFVCDNSQYLEKALQWGFRLDGKKLQDLSETRMMLESQNAYLAAERATVDDVEAIGNKVRDAEVGCIRDEPEEPGGHQVLVVIAGHLVCSQHLDDHPVVALVVVDRMNDPVSPPPDLSVTVQRIGHLAAAVPVAVPPHIHPVPAPPLTVMRARQ